MTVIAGAFDLDGHTKVPETISAALLAETGRNARSALIVDRGDRHIIAKLDIGAYGDGTARQGKAFACVAGHPLLTTGDAPLSRRESVMRLAGAARDQQFSEFDRARGTYLFVLADGDRLTIVGDHCGVRPLYYTRIGSLLVFASALKILRAVLDLRPCWQGRTEAAVFGYPLGDRTPYEGVFRIRESQWLVAENGELRSGHYHDWPASAQAPPPTLDVLYETFEQGVGARLAASPDPSRALAFLSGGLDSRAVVTQLAARGARVQALNFSPRGTQDREYARAFAAQFADESLKLDHFELESYNFPRWSMVARDALTRLGCSDAPHRIWSGDGGSVGLGFVYLNRAVIAHAEHGDFEGAARAYLRANDLEIPNLILKSGFRRKAEKQLLEAVVSEMERYDGQTACGPHFFLLFNDQRRHLAMHFEDIDGHRLELELPFFDGEFLKHVVALPPLDGLCHGTYMRWFSRFPAAARAVPWQTYPGHVPCPLSGSDEHKNQWDNKYTHIQKGNGRAQRSTRSLAQVAAPIFRPGALRLVSLLHSLGIRDYTYVLDWVETLGGNNADRRL